MIRVAADLMFLDRLGIPAEFPDEDVPGEDACWRRSPISGLPCLLPCNHPGPCGIGRG